MKATIISPITNNCGQAMFQFNLLLYRILQATAIGDLERYVGTYYSLQIVNDAVKIFCMETQKTIVEAR